MPTRPLQSQCPFQQPRGKWVKLQPRVPCKSWTAPGLHSGFLRASALPQVHAAAHLEQVSPGRDPAMTQANEPCRQEGEGARRRQRRGSDTHGPCLSTSSVSGVSREPVPTSRSSHSGTSESAWLQELRSPPQHRCRRPFRRGATRAVLTWATVPWRRAHERREVELVRLCRCRMLSQGRGGRQSCAGWSRGRRRETETGRGGAQRRAPRPLEAVGGEAGKVSNRTAAEPGTRAGCSSQPPRPAGIPARRPRH